MMNMKQNSTYKIPDTAIDVTCKSGAVYKVFMSLDEPMMYNVKSGSMDICTETDTPDSIECMVQYYKIDEKTAKSYINTDA